MTLKKWLEFNKISDGNIYIVTGGNTFDIKDDLKAAGARYHRELGWFFGTDTNPEREGAEYRLPAEYRLYHCTFNDTMNWNGYNAAYVKEDKYDEIKELHKVPKAPKELSETELHSDFYGVVGDRLKKVDAIFKGARWIDSDWGGSFIYTFEYDGNIFIWFSQSEAGANLPKDTHIVLSGTVKAHKEFNGIKQTYLSRCIIKEG